MNETLSVNASDRPSPPRLAETILRVEELRTYFFTERGVVKAVDGVSLDLGRDETLAVIGESGSGKTMTALSVLGLVPAPGRVVGGEVVYAGKDLRALPADSMRQLRGDRISMIFQDPMSSLDPVYTIGQQIAEVFQFHRSMSKDQVRRRVIELLELVHIPSAEVRYGAYPHELSGGMKQRAMIAMAVALEPDILIADEPTTALDVTIQAQILSLFEEIQDRQGTSILFITHDLGVAADIADRIVVMYAGKIVEMASTRRILTNPLHPYTRGLLQSIPRLGDRKRELIPIQGQPVDLLKKEAGCSFAPRCPSARAECRHVDLELRAVGEEGHTVRCVLYE